MSTFTAETFIRRYQFTPSSPPALAGQVGQFAEDVAAMLSEMVASSTGTGVLVRSTSPTLVLFRRGVTAGITASTTQTQGRGALTMDVNQVSVCANVNDTVTLPTAAAGLEIIVINSGAQTLKVFPASGDNLGAGVDTATTQATTVTNRYVAYDATNWVKL